MDVLNRRGGWRLFEKVFFFFLSCKCIFFFLFRERGLQVLKKSRMRQLKYSSGVEPQHKGLGQHLYNSQSSIGSGQDGDELQLV